MLQYETACDFLLLASLEEANCSGLERAMRMGRERKVDYDLFSPLSFKFDGSIS